MLKTLEINNVALISKLSIDFSNNFTVLTGETGAGKSIIIDSLHFVMGGKCSKSLIKQNEKEMKVTAFFVGPFSMKVMEFLKEFDLEDENELVLTRKLNIDGKGDTRINGNIVPLSIYKKLTINLVDIHGQNEHQKILEDKYHLEIVDSFVKDKSEYVKYDELFLKLKEINKDIISLNGSSENQERMLDLLNYQINEIESASLKENEDEILENRKLVMQNTSKIFDGLDEALKDLDGEVSCSDQIKRASNKLLGLTKFDEELSKISERLNDIKYEIMDIQNVLKDKRDSTSFNEYEYEEIENRLDKIKTLKKKYGGTLEKVFEFLDNAKKEYDKIKNSKELLIKKLKEKDDLLQNLFEVARIISKTRKAISKTLENKVNKELADLGMKNARFCVFFDENFEETEKSLTSNGFDKICFMFSANIGQDLKPLSEIISGGEASRFMLAIKNITSNNDDIELMVFDEIDTGISGEMGYKVACKLANISRTHQVVSVSHLPQICAMADKNIFVNKFVENNNTCVEVKDLEKQDVLYEISRLSGGSRESLASISHAKELKERCDSYKKSL